MKKHYTRSLISGILTIAAILLTSQSVYASSLTLTWTEPTLNADGSQLDNLAGYRIYYGLSGQIYTDMLDVGDVTEATVTGLEDGSSYDFAVTAYNSDMTESSFSIAVTAVVQADNPDIPQQVLFIDSIAPLDGGGISLSWQSSDARTYRVESSAGLSAPFETRATGLSATPPINIWHDLQPTSNGMVFYRIVEES